MIFFFTLFKEALRAKQKQVFCFSFGGDLNIIHFRLPTEFSFKQNHAFSSLWRDFLGGPVVRALRIYCRGFRLDLWLGTKSPQISWCAPQKTEMDRKGIHISSFHNQIHNAFSSVQSLSRVQLFEIP